VRFFTAALPDVANARDRRTTRAEHMVRLFAHGLGGRSAERLVGRIGLPLSDDTLLRRLKKSARPATSCARIIGLDEWAKRKGTVYGTIIVDLERRTVIDLLDQHSTEAVEKWLSEHPGIHTICRDRNGRYARAARTTAPNAKQVADRFHLVQNLSQTRQPQVLRLRVFRPLLAKEYFCQHIG
jgi:hypothetical protein